MSRKDGRRELRLPSLVSSFRTGEETSSSRKMLRGTAAPYSDQEELLLQKRIVAARGGDVPPGVKALLRTVSSPPFSPNGSTKRLRKIREHDNCAV